jgi:heat-inducible transcriptional repressor
MGMLCERDKKVLNAVVQSYIDRPDPVGSRFVTKRYPFNLSSATIRNIMADLEESGFLMQPHTSAGRVPTDKGYRFYVDSIKHRGGPDEELMDDFRRRFEALRVDMDNLLKEATVLLSAKAHNLVFAVPLMHERATLNRIHLYRYRKTRTVVVLMTNEGIVKNRILDSDFGLAQRDLNRVSDFLNSEFGGCTIDEIRIELLKQMSREKALCDVLISKAVAICNEALTFPNDEIILSGISELLGLPEFSDSIEEVVRAIENKHRILKLLGSFSCVEGVKVVIGSENPDEVLKGMSIVMASYAWDGRFLGSLGMIGPTRMDYSRVIPMVDMTAKFISAAMSGSPRRESV